MAILARAFLVFALLSCLSLQQALDPLVNFCRRFGHQTCVIDNRLYIDGGLINYNPISQYPLNYSNTGLLYADFTVNNQGMPQEYKNLSKPATAPDVSGGILWPDTVNKYFYLYGGEFQNSPQPFALWQYDVIHDNWTSMNPDPTQAGLRRASWGAGLAVQDRAIAYYYGGWLTNMSEPTWGATPYALSTMLMYDMIQNTWTNSTGPDSTGRAEGVMLYIPASDGGMLVYFGGIQTPTNNGTWVGQTLDTIFLYDIANSKWYTQEASGDVPDERSRFCAGATWSDDESSYNIYLYGGASMPPYTVGFDDVYILTIPSFQWIKWYPTTPGEAYPHHSLTCNVVNNNQMLVMGGTFPNASTCDAPNVYGFHNLDLSKNNPSDAEWYQFNYSKQGYDVPPEIISVVGGGGTGGATSTMPKTGFDSQDLSVYFTRHYTAATTRTATRAIPASTGTSKSKASEGAIIGGAVGGGIGALLIITALVCFCLSRRRKRTAQAAGTAPQVANGAATHTSQQSWQGPNQPPGGYYQLHAEPYQPPVELAAGRTSVKPSFISSSPGEKYSELSSSPPPVGSPQTGYFSAYTPTSATNTPRPMYAGHSPSVPQPYYPPPSGSPGEPQQYYPPPGEPQVYQTYSPSQQQQQHYPPPTGSSHSPGVSPGGPPSAHIYAPNPEISLYQRRQ